MKGLLILFVHLLPTLAFSQNVSGSFCTPVDYEGECISFYDDSEFEYEFWTCMGGSGGAGRYELTQDSLLLYFTKAGGKEKANHFEIQDSDLSTSDSVTVVIKVLDGMMIPMFLANLLLGTTKNPDSLYVMATAVTDMDGKAVIKIPKSDSKGWLTCLIIGTTPTFIELDLQQNYQLIGYIDWYQGMAIIVDEVYEYKIHSLEKHKLILQSKNGNSNEPIISTFTLMEK